MESIKIALRAPIRTAVIAAVAWLGARGIDVDSAALETVLVGLAIGGVNLVINVLERYVPFLSKIISLGTAASGPEYEG